MQAWQAGVVITFIGFFITIWNVLASKKAAKLAEEAANKIRSAFIQFDSVAKCSQTISALNEIKTLQRNKIFKILPERYSDVRRLLVSLRGMGYELSLKHKKELQSAIAHMSCFENFFDALALKNLEPSKREIGEANRIVGEQIDRLCGIQIFLKQRMTGGINNGDK